MNEQQVLDAIKEVEADVRRMQVLLATLRSFLREIQRDK